MRRPTGHLLTALSVLPCAAVAASWAASFVGAAGAGAAFDEVPDPAAAVEHRRGSVRFVLPLRRQTLTAAQVFPFPPMAPGPGEGSPSPGR